ncbi:S8 family serine peptidase [Balneolaceae bacterium]|jgi:subtilisin family serine protease|nr:S8 family serine peptidase [Balneolaceae bacterium]MDC0592215.1 S8 family serine peptidase [Balneolaceae bacterium]
MSYIKYGCLLLGSVIFFHGCSTNKAITKNDQTTSNAVDTEQLSDSTATQNIVTLAKPIEGWHLLGASTAMEASANEWKNQGIALHQAYSLLDSTARSPKKVVVAIIDSGSDVDHEDLKDNIWINNDEVVGNMLDDDANGYVDDVFGWNFIGGQDSSHVNYDTYELTRLYVKGLELFSVFDTLTNIPDSLTDEYLQFKDIEEEFEAERSSLESELIQIKQLQQNIESILFFLGETSLDSVEVNNYLSDEIEPSMQMQEALGFVALLQDNGINEQLIDEYIEQIGVQLEYGYNISFDPRSIVGDDYEDLDNRFYGNSDVKGPDYDHGTHVAGIIAANRDNNIGAIGITQVELMIIRAVPNGDERDKDVANAIRYAVDNGADVINMSFGKSYSPELFYVQQAIEYAAQNEVLMVHAAGNDGANIDSVANYPSPIISDGSSSPYLITVGASGWQGVNELAASFSNYGASTVDLFAPGVDIYSTMPNQEYELSNGTSMAAPVVSGVFALLMQYFPEYSPLEIKEIIVSSVVKTDEQIMLPGQSLEAQYVPFDSLSKHGGIVNAYRAVREALNGLEN